ncbi:hypothetical protein CPB83DRAFT_842020 [Crepidotus variabilis]|uniref:Uncharacterized protein n=1 Tax=Crepidotus variabilis TaxID=179855 RepID=A0A9P6JWF6_9AGAR|nr:hypothetical protein CPB83DRAFT_842020 [Crepidotus variabilis]
MTISTCFPSLQMHRPPLSVRYSPTNQEPQVQPQTYSHFLEKYLSYFTTTPMRENLLPSEL